jgi:hypothetical protein
VKAKIVLLRDLGVIKGGRMLDGKRYYAAFPDEDPKIRYPSALLDALQKLEVEFRKHFPTMANHRYFENTKNTKP